MKRFLESWLLPALLASGLTSCGDDGPGSGSVIVKWEVQGQVCADVDLVQVKVSLEQEGQVIVSDSTDCSEGEILLTNVPAETYDVRISGLDPTGHATYEGFYEGLVVDSGNDPSSPDAIVKLTQRPSRILLGWRFPDEAGTPCSFIGVSTVEVNVFRTDDPGDIDFSGEFPCDPVYADPETLPAPIENGAVVVGSLKNGETKVNLFGRDELGERIFKGTETLQLPVGGDVNVMVDLHKCEKKGCG